LFNQARSNHGRGTSRNASPIRPSEKKNGGEFFTKLQKIALSARITKELDKSPSMVIDASPDEQKISPSKPFFSLRTASFRDKK
jgi:hypothetical protein